MATDYELHVFLADGSGPHVIEHQKGSKTETQARKILTSTGTLRVPADGDAFVMFPGRAVVRVEVKKLTTVPIVGVNLDGLARPSSWQIE